VNGEPTRGRDSGGDPEERRTLPERLANRRRDRLAEDFRRTQTSTWPTWAYALALLLMIAVVAALLVYAANY
jgi:hypothetical protein